MLGVAKKQPGETLDYDVDFEKWLSEGDTMLSATAVAETGLTVDDVEVIAPLVKVWLSGGTAGVSYKVTVTLQTTAGRIKEADFTLRVVEC